MLRTRWYLGVGIASAAAMSLLLVTACGGGAAPATVATQAPTATRTPSLEPTATETARPVPTPTATRTVVTPTPASTKDPLIAKGEELFQKTAGGVGCQACHGRDAKGGIGPNIRAATVTRISLALSTVDQMVFIKLSPEEVQAVAAYLQLLATQP